MTHVVSGRMLGGGQRVAGALVRALRGAGWHAELCVLGCPGDAYSPADALFVPYEGRYADPRHLLATSVRLRARLARMPPGIVHTHGWDADIIAAASVRRADTHVAHLHVMPGWLESRRLRHRLRRALTRIAFLARGTRILAVADAVRSAWSRGVGIGAGRIAVVPNGVDDRALVAIPRTYRPVEPRGLVVGVAGRLASGKGFRRALEVVSRVRSRGLELTMRVAGAGPEAGALRSYAESAGVAPHVEWLGHVRDMPAFYASLDLFLMPSRREGLPLVLLEAMAAGLPVVATDLPGVLEVTAEARSARLVPVDDVIRMAQAVEALARDATAREDLGGRARRRVREAYTLDRVVRRLLAFYARVRPGARAS